VTVRTPLTLFLADAVTVEVVVEVTPEFVVTRTRTLFIPENIVAVLGTVAAFVLLLLRLMVWLPEGAAEFATAITFAVELLPPATVEGVSVSEPKENDDRDVPVVFFMNTVPPIVPPMIIAISVLPSLLKSPIPMYSAALGVKKPGTMNLWYDPNVPSPLPWITDTAPSTEEGQQPVSAIAISR
jgi:hypothetical protein